MAPPPRSQVCRTMSLLKCLSTRELYSSTCTSRPNQNIRVEGLAKYGVLPMSCFHYMMYAYTNIITLLKWGPHRRIFYC